MASYYDHPIKYQYVELHSNPFIFAIIYFLLAVRLSFRNQKPLTYLFSLAKLKNEAT